MEDNIWYPIKARLKSTIYRQTLSDVVFHENTSSWSIESGLPSMCVLHTLFGKIPKNPVEHPLSWCCSSWWKMLRRTSSGKDMVQSDKNLMTTRQTSLFPMGLSEFLHLILFLVTNKGIEIINTQFYFLSYSIMTFNYSVCL